MRARATLLLALTALVALSVPALADAPQVGTRAIDIRGRDVISDKVVALSDYAGKWVFVDFWASWCGPCMGELPNLLDVTAPLRKRDDFRVFTVSLDQPETDADLNDVIRKHKLTWPVIYDGGGWKSVQGQEWGINSIPATFLIDPQGSIVATGLRGEVLKPALEFFLNYPGQYAPISVATSHKLNDDGSMDVTVLLTNPRHTPLEVRAEYAYTKYIYAADDLEHKNRPVDYEYLEPNAEAPEETFSATFGDFGDAVHSFNIPASEGASVISYSVEVKLPETDHLEGGNGIWVSSDGRQKIEAPKPAQ